MDVLIMIFWWRITFQWGIHSIYDSEPAVFAVLNSQSSSWLGFWVFIFKNDWTFFMCLQISWLLIDCMTWYDIPSLIFPNFAYCILNAIIHSYYGPLLSEMYIEFVHRTVHKYTTDGSMYIVLWSQHIHCTPAGPQMARSSRMELSV